MQRLINFIHESLDSLPQPAALYTADGDFVDRNLAASHQLAQLLGHEPDEAELRDALDLDFTLYKAREQGWVVREQHDRIVVATRINALPQIPRPPLVLVTWHETRDVETATMDHRRVVVLFKINEQYDATARMLEYMAAQIDAMAKSQHEAVALLNEHTRDIVKRNYRNQHLVRS